MHMSSSTNAATNNLVSIVVRVYLYNKTITMSLLFKCFSKTTVLECLHEYLGIEDFMRTY